MADDHIISRSAREALKHGGRIVRVYAHGGSPGGHNNDRIILTMESGDKIEINAYAMTGMTARKHPETAG